MKTTPETLARIEKNYPEAFKALPKGYRFLNTGEELCTNDRVWSWGEGPFKAPDSPWGKSEKVDEDNHPIIRRVRPEKKSENTPTWPSVVRKEAAKDMIYIGMGVDGGIEGLTKGVSRAFYNTDATQTGFTFNFGNSKNLHYFIHKDHPIAHRYIKAKKPTLEDAKNKIRELERENAALKEKLAKIHNESVV